MLYSWFHCFLLFACICIDLVFSLPSSSELASVVSYTKHCSSIVPEYKITTLTNKIYLPPLDTSYFSGGDTFLRKEPGRAYFYVKKHLRLQIRPDKYYQTTAAGVYKVEGILGIRSSYSSGDDPSNYSPIGYDGSRNREGESIEFPMNGFWSEKSRKLCMLGSASWNGTDRDAVLKLKLEDEIPIIYTSIVSGNFESTASANDPSYFDPISIFSFPTFPNYYYSLVPKEAGAAFAIDSDARKDESLSVGATEFCMAIEWGLRNLELQYATECTSCSPVGTWLRFLSFSSIECPDGERKARFKATFQNYRGYSEYYDDFEVGFTLIGEVSWDDENKRMIGLGCGISNLPHELGNVVKNCTIKFSLRFPSVLNIRDDAKVVGQIWNSESADDSGYFDKISLKSTDEHRDVAMPELRYEYTELDRVRKLCPSKKPAKKGNVYPDGNSYNMRFDMNIKNAQDQLMIGANARPSWVGNDSYKDDLRAVPPVGPESYAAILHARNNTSPAEMTYKISIAPFFHGGLINVSSLSWTMNPNEQVDMTAEGLYDAKNGFLCMVGCRKVNSSFNDCDMVVELEFPPLNGNKGALIKGMIRSTRATNDALYFDNLIIQSAAPYAEGAVRSIWRMDFEIIMVLISNMLVCIFVGLQIFHVKRNHEVPSFVSVVMLVILCIGLMIPLVLNFDAVYLGIRDKQILGIGSGGSLEANEVAVRLITMVTLLLQLRLFQLVWTAKQNDTNGKGSRVGEIKASFVCLSLYIMGWLLTLLINWVKKTYVSPYSSNIHRDYSVWEDLRLYAGLILDGFLVPQIILNIFRGSAKKALSHPFYVGMSAVRLVPHAYNQYRTHNYPKYDLNATYYYANPAADFYSTAWDIIIPFGIVVLVVILFLQQLLGGRCILPKRFRSFEMYEKLPKPLTSSEEENAEYQMLI